MAKDPKKPPTADTPEDFVLPAGKRATSYDVARLAGVSQSAVSRCFKPGASVSEKMRQRVIAAAEQLGWQPNAIARGLITRRSNLVAVLIPGGLNLYYPEVLFTLTERLAADGLRVLLFAVEAEGEVDAILDQVWQYQVDGVISASHLSKEQARTLATRQIPVVFFNRYFEDYSADVVWCDPVKQTRELISELIDFGHRDFGLIHGPEANMVARRRMQGVATELARHGVTRFRETRGDFTYDSGGTALQAMLRDGPPPTAVVSANDMMALGCIDEARGVLGFAVPDDLSVVGFDGIGMARFGSYELTTIRQPIRRMCEAAVSILNAHIEQPERSHEKRVFEGMVLRGSTIARARQSG